MINFKEKYTAGSRNQEQQNIAFNLSNIFEIKTTADPTDTTSKENKIQLLNLGLRLSYNFAADSLKLSDISLTLPYSDRRLFQFLRISTFSPYD